MTPPSRLASIDTRVKLLGRNVTLAPVSEDTAEHRESRSWPHPRTGFQTTASDVVYIDLKQPRQSDDASCREFAPT